MSVEKSLELFSAVPKTHNCAQAVAGGCGCGGLVPELAAAGGGRAPEGLCGALYAAILIAGEHKEKIMQEFAEAAGDVTCREIKTGSGFPCCECVLKGAELAEKYRNR